MAIDLTTLLGEVALLAGSALIQTWLAQSLKKIEDDGDLSLAQKRQMAMTLIESAIQQGFATGQRMYFHPNRQLSEKIVNSAAVEAIHDFYFDACHRIHCSGDMAHRGGIFAVYDKGGMGKSKAVLSLLLMKHGRAPKLGLWFGGNRSSFSSGDDYYNKGLLNGAIGKGCELTGLVDPTTLATKILDLVPSQLSNVNSKTCGVRDIPGLSDYFESVSTTRGRRAGGFPVIVFEDVNVHGLKDDFSIHELGSAHEFFDAIMTQAFDRGNIVIVTTKVEKVARFFEMLNEGTKSKVVIRSEESVKDMFPKSNTFGWDSDKRLEFLKQRCTADGISIPISHLQKLAVTQKIIRELSNDLDSQAYSNIVVAPTTSSVDAAYDFNCFSHSCSLM